jgi:hypothetical protein
MTTPLEIALGYIAEGWSPIPIPYKGKDARGTGWPKLRVTATSASRYFNGVDQNIGVLLGPASHNLTDIDLDCQEAILAAPYFLPRTRAFGRPSKSLSHWLYYSNLSEKAGIGAVKQYKDPADPAKQMILEVRIGGSGKGSQSVFPGSTHESGEAITWADSNIIESIDGDDLLGRAIGLAACALLARHYPIAGGRHDAALVVGGFLARCGCNEAEIKLFAEGLAVASGQPSDKRKDIVRTAIDAAKAFAAGGTAAGLPKLTEVFGDAVANQCAKWLGYQPGATGAAPAPSVGATGLPVIRLHAGELPRLVDDVEAAVAAADRGLYNRAGQLVSIADIGLLGCDEKKVTTLAIVEQDEYGLLEIAAASAQYEKYDGRAKKHIPADPPMALVRTWRARKSESRLPSLSGIISTPLILPTGRIIEAPGYDAATGLFFNPLGVEFPPVPTNPTQDDARAAMLVLENDLLAEFPFVDEASKAVALSGLLTSVSRKALDFAFMHAVTAPAYGSGKSFLIDVFCMLATGRCAPVTGQGRTSEEFDKHLDAHLLTSAGHLAIDNISRPLEGEKLCQILTQTSVEVRLFHTQDKVVIDPRIFITATGTNLVIIEDLRRRSLLCSLDAKLERPELRKFTSNPLTLIQQDRGKYVAAANTALRAGMLGIAERSEPVNGYERYCAMIRDLLLWLGYADPCGTMETIRKQDTRLAAREQIARQWKALIGNEPKTTVQVITLVTQKDMLGSLLYPDFHAALQEITKGKPLTPAGLGYWLRSVKDDRFSLLEDHPYEAGQTCYVPHWFKSYERAAESNFWELTWT